MTSGRKQVAELIALRAHVSGTLTVLRLHDRNAVVDAQPIALQANQLARIVRDRSDRANPEIEEDLRPDAIVAKIGLEAELLVRLDRIGAAILQLVRLELVEQAYTPPFLIQVHDDAASLGGD